jgi:2-polyprenyl-3-methyl-5-hydroxy-6-metoxy-1,4-benzoquinol methylase
MHYNVQKDSVFLKLIENIAEKSFLQKKRITKFLSEQDETFWETAEGFVKTYLDRTNISIDKAADYYLQLCNNMFVEQLNFAKTGAYSNQSIDQANRAVYSNPEVMNAYMHGVALSQFLWENHYKMFNFFCQEILKSKGRVKKYLEIGVGHGLFLSQALNVFKKATSQALDISETSLAIAKKILGGLSEDYHRVEFINRDVMSYSSSLKFDFITMGEVLEHVENPQMLMCKLRELIAENGMTFVLTCFNCPAIDHVYLFKNVQEVRQMFKEAGLKINKEIILPVEKTNMKNIATQCVAINYAVILEKCLQ